MTPAELRALAEAATDGPWRVRNDNPRGVYLWSARIETLADFGADPGATPDAMLAALAPDLALLCAEWADDLRFLSLADGANAPAGMPTYEFLRQTARAALAKLAELEAREAEEQS